MPPTSVQRTSAAHATFTVVNPKPIKKDVYIPNPLCKHQPIVKDVYIPNPPSNKTRKPILKGMYISNPLKGTINSLYHHKRTSRRPKTARPGGRHSGNADYD